MSNKTMKNAGEIYPNVAKERVAKAYLAAAIGDCLGWPFEGHARRVPSVDKWDGDFFPWTKRSGGRFRPYLEDIGLGEYSDDTQLILAITRSRLHSVDWWNHFAQCELPFWTFYERGGGGATKRAATSWLTSGAPWRANRADLVQKYLSAGGNGVAMRVLPHCAVGANQNDFADTARDILTDGVVTHGHPRALVGALAYGFALWYVLKLNRTLNFGELVQATIENVSSWSTPGSIQDRWDDWHVLVNATQDYQHVWEDTVGEMVSLLHKVYEGVQAGALAIDRDVLDSIGATNIKTNGAGTVSAATAIYFASRYAASPAEGLQRAASAIGSDTDTNASMTGSLLGALSGSSWFTDLAPYLQDRRYIEEVAAALVENKNSYSEGWAAVRRIQISQLGNAIKNSEFPAIFKLPNGMKVLDITEPRPTVDKMGVKTIGQYKIRTVEGLTLFYKRPFDRASDKNEIPQEKVDFDAGKVANERLDPFIGLSLAVSNLDNSLIFYNDVLELPISGKTVKTVRFGNFLAFKEQANFDEAQRFVTIFLHVSDVNALHNRLAGFNYPNVSQIGEKSNRRFFTCLDPDGYIVEIVESEK